MKFRLLGCVSVCVLAVAACGGDNATTGDGGPDGSLGDGGNPSDATTQPDGSTKPDGSTDASSDASTDATKSDGGGATSVKCGNSSCALPGPCCIVNGNTPACISDGGSCQQGDVGLQCATNADCPSSQVCCLDANNQNTPAATCAATCNAANQAVLCDPNGTAQANRCGDAGACTSSNNGTWGLPNNGYGVCGGSQGPF